jgi:hypothetical protein
VLHHRLLLPLMLLLLLLLLLLLPQVTATFVNRQLLCQHPANCTQVDTPP